MNFRTEPQFQDQRDNGGKVKTDDEPKYLSTGKHIILIAEDLEMNARLLSLILRSYLPNSEIIIAENGIKAWEAFNNYTPDIIFMDIQMPVMDGVKVAEKIRNSGHSKAEVPIIAISAGSAKEQKPRCLKAGINEYLSKPVLKTVIGQILAKYLK